MKLTIHFFLVANIRRCAANPSLSHADVTIGVYCEDLRRCEGVGRTLGVFVSSRISV